MPASLIPTNHPEFAGIVPVDLARAPKGGKLAIAGAPLRDLQDHLLRSVQHNLPLEPVVHGKLLVNLQALLDACKATGYSVPDARKAAIGTLCLRIFGNHTTTESRQGSISRLSADLARDGRNILAFLDNACDGIEEAQRVTAAAEAAAKAATWASFSDTVRGATLALANVLPLMDAEVLASMATAQVAAQWRKEGKPVPRKV